MKKSVATKWIKALRSGKFKQAEGFLKIDDDNGNPTHCCLGVLCELYNDEMRKSKKKTLSGTRFGSSDNLLPRKVMNWAGMQSRDGQFGTGLNDLTLMNDHGQSFKVIANAIEKNTETL
jgi:hypothetical protein